METMGNQIGKEWEKRHGSIIQRELKERANGEGEEEEEDGKTWHRKRYK